jgi:gliding motility-associated-like protein
VVSVSGGVPGYIYLWAPTGQTGATATGLSQGIYTVQITDTNGCMITDTVTVAEPAALTATTSTTAVLCNGGSTGTASVTSVSGGVPGYTYLWTPTGQTGATATGLSQGMYTVQITDTNGCMMTDTVTVTEPAALLTTTSTTDVLCNGGNTGTASVVSVSGGVPGYTYLWTPTGQTGATATGLSAGTYNLVVTDANGCSYSTTAIVNEPTVLSATTSFTPVVCNGGFTGTASVTSVSGGVPGYAYLWTPTSQTGATATALSQGTYTVQITDADGCTITYTVTVTEPAPITTSAGPDQIICDTVATMNAQLLSGQTGVWNVALGSGTFTYADSANTQVTGLTIGNNILLWSIVDASGCTASASVSVLTYASVQAVASSPDTTICLTKFTSYDLIALNPAPGTGLWSVAIGNSGGIASPSSLTTQYTSPIEGANIILWTVTNGPCSARDTVIITIKNDGDCLELELPTGYTPNGDGYNDSYIVHGLEAYPENTFIVFNRWGNEVFKKDNYKNNGNAADWYGQNKSDEPLPDGTYYVILVIKNSSLHKNTYVDLRR